MSKTKKKYYLTNKQMLPVIEDCRQKDRMTDEFAKQIQLLIDRYASSYIYSDYQPHIEDMKSAAMMNIVRGWRSFDPNQSSNAFAYFTQSIKYSFWQYCTQEKKHRLVRDELLINMGELPSDAYLQDYEQEREKQREESEDALDEAESLDEDYDDEEETE
jgi:DNA-directed RNA polymerase specialized sigma subunit